MTRRLSMALVAWCVLTLAATSAGWAHEGHEHKILGTVTMAAPDHLMLEDRDGTEVTVYITEETKVRRENSAAKVEDIEVGMRVAIVAVMKDEKMLAKTIELGGAPGTK